MRENPPHSITEIRLRLSRYLDGVLDAEEMVETDSLLEAHPAYKQEFLKMQAIRAQIQAFASDNSPTENIKPPDNPLWGAIEKQLKADQRAEALPCDPEFISAYYDGEIPVSDPAFSVFEAQLSGNDEASRMLSDIGQVSETIRRFGYRLEEACTVDVTHAVMKAFQVELLTTEPDLNTVSLTPEAEIISAFVDEELTPREIIEANRLIESNEAARNALNTFNRLSDGIQSISEQIQQQAPDCTTQVLTRFRQEGFDSEVDGEVIPFTLKSKRAISVLRMGLPAAAAAVVILMLSPVSIPNPFAPLEPASGLSIQPQAGRELASVPSGKHGLVRISSRQDLATGTPIIDASVTPPDTPPLRPILEAPSQPVTHMAMKSDTHRQNGSETHSTTIGKHRQTPSSDEYLFQALSEEMPNEDITVLLGN